MRHSHKKRTSAFIILVDEQMVVNRLGPLKAWLGPNLQNMCPKVLFLREFAEKLSNLATVENIMTLTQF